MTRLALGEWLPDQPSLGNKGLTDVGNAIPAADFWLPQPRPIKVSDQPIVPPIQGLWTATRTQGDSLVFVAFGGKIYRVPGFSDPLVDVSKAGGYSLTPTLRWRIAQNANVL